jgi:succinylglutamic semialdehyde dehydrogenase
MRTELFINGAWRAGTGDGFASRDPAYDVEVWQGASASAHDVADAVTAAQRAFPLWASTDVAQRIETVNAFARAIDARAEALALTISREVGKAAWEASAEVATMIGKVNLSIRAYHERTGQKEEKTPFGTNRLDHRPHGVMAVLGPFNFPGHLPNGHIVPALLAGNSVVFKASEYAPGVGALMVEAWEAAGLPPGVLNLVQGGRETGAALLAQPQLNGVLFTGSAAAGVHIHRLFAGRVDVILALELGGNNPLIVWPPADAGACANLIAQSSFITTGQRCSCARRVIVPRGAFGDSVIEALAALAAQIKPGAYDQSPQPFCGPLAHRRAAAMAEEAERELIALGGRAIARLSAEGAFVRPAIIDMTDAAPAPDEEVFAPLAQVIRVGSFEEALARANATRFGLAGALLCDDPALWARAQRELRIGVLNWNRPSTGASGAMPFGGPGLSGSGRPSAFYAADYCAYPVAQQTAEKAVAIPVTGLPI